MKTCTKCGIAKALSEFARRKTARGTLQSWCRECQKVHAAERYARFTPEQRSDKRRRSRERSARLREAFWRLLLGKRCVDCAESDPVVLDFDHLGEKLANVGDMVARRAWAVVEQEIAKCEVVCANCHRRRTAQRARAAARLGRTDGKARPRTRMKRAAARRTARPVVDVVGVDIYCPRCRRLRPSDAFAWRSRATGARQPWCRDCHNAHKRAFYELNREQEIARARRRQEIIVAENRPRLRTYLEQHTCVDCGEGDVDVLDFDHLRDKRNDVTTMLWSGLLWSTIEAEIAKCEVRCANCHRRRTAKQRGYDERKRGVGEEAVIYGEPGGTRTPGHHVRSVVLYPLSYRLSRRNSTANAPSGTG